MVLSLSYFEVAKDKIFLFFRSFFGGSKNIPFPSRSVTLSIFIKIPDANMKTIRELPPALMYGKGNPVGGIEPLTTAILTKVCTPITAEIPVAKRL